MKKETPLKIRYLIKLLSNIVNGLINVILVAFVPTALGTQAYGEFSYLFQFFTRLYGFISAGSPTAFFTKLSANPYRKNLVGFYLFVVIAILFVVFLSVYLVNVLGFRNIVFPDIEKESYIYLSLLFLFLTFLFDIYLKISDAYVLTTSVEIVKIVYKLVYTISLIGVIQYFYFDLDIYLIFNIVATSLFLIATSSLFIKKGVFSKEIFQNIQFSSTSKEFLEYIAPLFVTNSISIAIGFFQIWLLQKFGGAEESGYYGLAYQIGIMSFLFTSAMTQIITREFSKSFGEGDIETIRRLFLRYVPMLYSISAFFSLFVLFQAENVISLFTDDRFLEAVPVVMVMSFYPIHQTYGQLSTSLFYATERTKKYRNISLVSQTIMLGLSILFIYFLNLGAVGLGLTMVIGQLIGTNLQLVDNSKYLNMDYLYLVRHQIISILLFLTISYIASLFSMFQSPLVNFLFSGVVYLGLVGVAIYLYPDVLSLKKEELSRIMKKVFRRER